MQLVFSLSQRRGSLADASQLCLLWGFLALCSSVDVSKPRRTLCPVQASPLPLLPSCFRNEDYQICVILLDDLRCQGGGGRIMRMEGSVKERKEEEKEEGEEEEKEETQG